MGQVGVGEAVKDFFCENSRFKTNTDKGFAHSPKSETRGSVFEEPLFVDEKISLWLEHVVDKIEGGELFWLMFYDDRGTPKIRVSAVFDKKDFAKMQALLATFVP